jgi:molybdate transport system ATP-binding protein
VFEIDVEIRRSGRVIAAACNAPAGLTGLYGVSGAGKTTLLDMVAGLLSPDQGRIVVGGVVVFDKDAGVNLSPQQRGCGYVFQDNRLFPHMNVRDNLTYGMRRNGVAVMSLDQALEFLGIGALVARMPQSLSGGEAQRVAIGRALLSAPRFLLMDEPLVAVDRARRDAILRLIERVRDELGLPILYVSHDRGELDRLAGMVVELG